MILDRMRRGYDTGWDEGEQWKWKPVQTRALERMRSNGNE